MAKKKKKKQEQLKEDNDLLTRIIKPLIWAGLGLTLLVPLLVDLNSFFPFVSYRGYWFMGATQVTFALWLFLAYHNQEYRPRPNLVLLAMILFMLSITLSTIFSVDTLTSFWSKHERMIGLLTHLHLFAYFLVLMSFLKNEESWRPLFAASIVIASISSIWGIGANYDINFIIEFFDLFGIVNSRLADISGGGSTLGQTSFMGSYLLLNAFFAFYLIIKTQGRIRIAAAVFLLIITLGIFLNPRGAAMKGSYIFAIGLFVLLYLAFEHKHHLLKMGSRAILALGLLAAPVIGILTFVEGSLVRNLVLRLSGLPGRMVNWEAALQALTDRPLLGWGLENFEIALYTYYDPRVMLPFELGYRAEPWHDRAHNVIIDFLTTTGILGTLLFFSIFACALFVLWKNYLSQQKTSYWTTAIITTLIAAHMLQNLTVFDMLPSYMLIFLVLALAASQAESLWPAKEAEIDPPAKKQKAQKNTPGKPAPVLYSYLLAAVLLFFLITAFNYFVYRPYQGGIYAGRGMQTNHQGSLLEYYPKAIETSPLGRHHLRRTLTGIATDRLDLASPEAIIEIHFPEVEYMIAELEATTEESPYNFRYFYSLGLAYNSYGLHLGQMAHDPAKHEQAQEAVLLAEEAFREALAISPNNVNAYWGLAQNMFLQTAILDEPDLLEEAVNYALEARSIEPRLIDSHLIALRIAAGPMNNEELAMEIIEEALKVDARWEDELMAILDQ